MNKKILTLWTAGMLWTLSASGPAWAADYHDNVVIVLDASGSMRGKMPGGIERMAAAKNALKQVISHIPKETHVGLLVFSASNVRDDWVYPLGPRDDAKLIQAIDTPQPGSGTPLGAYLKKGADRLLEERAKQHGYGSYRLLVVTDGEAGDTDLVEKYTPDVLSRGIIMDVIGVAMKQDHTLARKAHSYRRANDPASLTKALQEVFAELSTTQRDVAQEDAFSQIAPLPEGLASAMIQALANSGNDPVGVKRRAAAVPAPPAEGEAKENSPAPAAPSQAAPQAPPPAGRRIALPAISFFVLFVAVALGIKIFSVLFRR